MRILFFDAVAYKPYSCKTLREEALGGSEASLLRVARGLAKEGLDISVFQLIDDNREPATIEGIKHVNGNIKDAPDVMVHFRTAQFIPEFREMWPNTRQIFWTEDLGGDWLKDEPLSGEEILCVSDFHVKQFGDELAKVGQTAKSIKRIYNPIEVDGARLDKVEGRLGFFSSPHKGLHQVMAAFTELKKTHPLLHLVISNPGYMPNDPSNSPDIENLGQLNHPRVLEEMSKCQVLFQVQTVFAETFGNVLAEANAMGVPVISHDMGSAMEVLMGCNQEFNSVIQADDPAVIRHALAVTLEAKSTPVLDPRFSEAAVIAEWKALLGV